MGHPVARLMVIVASIVAFGAATSPSLAQSALPAASVYLPAISKPRPVEIVDSTRGWFCKALCVNLHGHVRNNTDRPVYAVLLKAVLYDRSGQAFDEVTVSAALPAVFPGQSSPFTVRVGSPADYLLSTFEVTIAGYTDRTDVLYVPVTVVSQREGGIVGEVRNDYAVPLTAVQIVVSTAEGDYARAPLITDLAPGAVAPYAVNVVGRYWDDDNVTV